MSYNGSGTFNVNTAGQPVVTGTVISSTAFNALTADLATGLSTAITKDGQTTTTARITFAQGISSTLVTDATSATTGSIITAGGISCQKALWVGTTSRHVGATQFDAAITYGGVTLSNAVTGTGNMVLSASPTLTGTLTAATISASATATATAFIPSGSSVPTSGVYLPAANSLGFSTNSTERMRLDTSGNLGIGTTGGMGFANYQVVGIGPGASAGGILQFQGASNADGAHLRLDRSGSTISSFTIETRASAPMLFGINGSEKMRLGSDGSFLVGTTTNGGWTTVAKLEALAGTGNQALSGYNNGSSGNALVLRVDSDTANLINFNRNGSQAGSFISTGGATPNIQWLANNEAYVFAGGSGGVKLTSGATAWASASDETLKTDLVTIQSGAEKVASLRAVTGRYKTDAENVSRSFLIAQDVQKVLPEAVSVDADGTLSLRYSEVIPLLVAAIQELNTRVNTLENN